LYSPQDENHPARPRSPYGASKCAARTIVKVYRESYGLYAVQGWLFNHEGVRRGEKFVTRKITKGVARIKNELRLFTCVPIELGNIDAKRDWSDAEDMVDAIWRMLNQEKYNVNFPCSSVNDPNQSFKNMVLDLKDYVCSNNETHTIREFIEIAFDEAGLSGTWYITNNGLGDDPLTEVFRLNSDFSKVLVKINPEFYRPAEVELLLGDSSKIRKDLGWSPKTDFRSLIKKMVANDLKS
jgi:GDPmannose 4,6-dehydratase